VADSVVRTTRHNLAVSEVRDIQITDIVLVGGVYTRAIRIYGEPGGTQAPPVVELVVSSPDRADIEVMAPERGF